MSRVCVNMSPEIHRAVLGHLLPVGAVDEEAAFLFVRVATTDDFEVVEWTAIDRGGFAYQSSGYLELVEEMGGRLIKKAHDLGCTLAEMHSHPYTWEAAFSPTDLSGLAEFAPHVRWRLRGRPYIAIVVAPSGFDALAWCSDDGLPEPILGIRVGGELLRPTGLTASGLRRGAL